MRPERVAPALRLHELLLRRLAPPGSSRADSPRELLVQRRVGRRDTQLAELDLRLHPRQVERALRAVRIVVPIRQLQRPLAVRRDERRERHTHRLAARDAVTRARSANTGSRTAPVVPESGPSALVVEPAGRRTARQPAQEPRAIRLAAHRPDLVAPGGARAAPRRLPRARAHMDAPSTTRGRRDARIAALPRLPFRLDEQIRERRLPTVGVVRSEHDLAVARRARSRAS